MGYLGRDAAKGGNMKQNLKDLLEEDIREAGSLTDRATAIQSYKQYLEAIGNYERETLDVAIRNENRRNNV